MCFALLIPQLIHIWKYKSAKDFSYWFLALNEVCSCCFVIYALIIGSLPILVSDGLLIVINTILIISKVILDKRIKDKTSIQDKYDEKEIELTEVENTDNLTEVENSDNLTEVEISEKLTEVEIDTD